MQRVLRTRLRRLSAGNGSRLTFSASDLPIPDRRAPKSRWAVSVSVTYRNADPAHTTATIRAAPALPVMRVLADFGVDPAAFLTEAGWPPDAFDDPERVVAYPEVGRLLAVAAARTGCQHLGLLVGREGGLQSLGALGFAVRHAADVRSALGLLVQHFAQHDRGGVVIFSEHGAAAGLTYRIAVPAVPGSQHIGDVAMAIGFQMMQAICGPSFRPEEISLARHRPSNIRPYLTQFGRVVRFDAEDPTLNFAGEWLDRPVAGADPELQRLILHLIGESERERKCDPGEDVRRVLAGMLGRGTARQEAVALSFGVSSRTLHRRLAVIGASFRSLLDGVRCEMARRLLEDTGLPVGEVALALDYSETSAFSRSFKRRFGCSPTAWRQQHAAAVCAAPDVRS